MKYWLSIARDNGNMLSLGTDSHYCEEIGNFTNSLMLLNELEFDSKYILNCNKDLLESL